MTDEDRKRQDDWDAINEARRERLFIQMRKYGVSEYSETGTIKMFPPEEPHQPGAIVPRSLALGKEPDKCVCSHEETAHDAEGLCLLGCPATICLKVKAAEAG